MTTLEIVLLILTILSWVALGISVRFTYVFAVKMVNLQNALEESLDIFDQKYATFTKILEIPIFFDSPEVRQVIEEIGSCRDSILYVANVLAASIDESAIEDEDVGE